MSAVIAAPEVMTSAATDLVTIGSTLSAAHLTAAPPTLSVLPAASDEVSTAVAHLFSEHAQDYQALAGVLNLFSTVQGKLLTLLENALILFIGLLIILFFLTGITIQTLDTATSPD